MPGANLLNKELYECSPNLLPPSTAKHYGSSRRNIFPGSDARKARSDIDRCVCDIPQLQCLCGAQNFISPKKKDNFFLFGLLHQKSGELGTLSQYFLS